MDEADLLRELKWLSPAAKTRAGEMIVAGEKAARTAGVKAPEGELDAFLFAVGRSRGQALMIVDSVATALDAAGDLAPKRDDGALETDKSRTYAERIEMLVRLARIGATAELHAAALKRGAIRMRDDCDTMVEHSGLTNAREYYARQDDIAALAAVLDALK